jgi:hypothetical protein
LTETVTRPGSTLRNGSSASTFVKSGITAPGGWLPLSSRQAACSLRMPSSWSSMRTR